MKLSQKRILIISPEPWGVNNVSKHHYAKTLAQNGNQVYFLNPPILSLSTAFKLTRAEGFNNLTIIDYKPLFRGLNKLPDVMADFLNKIALRRIAKAWGNAIDIVWSFDPFRFQQLNDFHARLKIYHAVDVHQTLKEKKIAATADLIFTTSSKICDRLLDVSTPKYNIGHGVASYFFENKATAKNLPGESKIKVGYIGNLHSRLLAKDILIEIVKEYPSIDFIFIGPYTESNLSKQKLNDEMVGFLKSSPNCYLLGPIPSDELPQYMCGFDLFLLCYTGDEHIAELANPHKILEYLSTGKVVVSCYIDEYRDKRTLLEMAQPISGLPAIFSRTVHDLKFYNSDEKMNSRRHFALNNTYLKQLSKIESYIAD